MSVARAIDLRPEDLAGRSWAGYLRGSTCGQADRYGPDLQRAEQCQSAERHGLLPTGREYVDLVSGKDTLRRTDFARIAVAMVIALAQLVRDRWANERLDRHTRQTRLRMTAREHG